MLNLVFLCHTVSERTLDFRFIPKVADFLCAVGDPVFCRAVETEYVLPTCIAKHVKVECMHDPDPVCLV